MRPTFSYFAGEPRADDDLTFHPSPSLSIGVEIELQILDPASRELAPGAVRILDACEEEKIPGISGEFLLCMIEAKTGVCQDVNEVRQTFVPALNKLGAIARSLGYELTSAGTHPYGRPLMSAIYPDDRYKRISDKQGWLAYQEAIFGMHVHVGIDDADEAMRISNYLSGYLPHLLALSANSPLWEGIDTNLASARARMFRPSPHVGAPPQFRSWSDLAQFVNYLRCRGVIGGLKDLYWDIRPRPDYGTLEFRIFDAPPTMEQLLMLVALTRSLVAFARNRVTARPKLGAPSFKRAWIANEQRWLASRYGLDATGVKRKTEIRTLGEECQALVRHLMPVAGELGDQPFLEPLLTLPKWTTGADRQRQTFRDQGRWQAVVDEMIRRWNTSLHPMNVDNGSTESAGVPLAPRSLFDPQSPPNHPHSGSRNELAGPTFRQLNGSRRV